MAAMRTTMGRKEKNLRKITKMPWPTLRKHHKLSNLKNKREHSNSSNNNNNNRRQQPMQQASRSPLNLYHLIDKLLK